MSSLVKLTPQMGGWSDADMADEANVEATKLQHREVIAREVFGPLVSVAAKTEYWFALTGCEGVQLVAIEAAIGVQATGADRTVTVDLQKSTGGGAFATVLSSTVDITDGTTVRSMIAGAINNTAIIEGDILQVVITVAGSADAQATGLIVAVTLDHKKPS